MCSVHRANSVDSKLTQMERMTESGAPEHSESTSKLYLAPFPGENPTELEFTTWLDGARDRLRVAKLLKHALNDAPAAPPDLAAKALIPTPGADVADTIKQSVLAKNMLITAENADRAAAWADRIREKADWLTASARRPTSSRARCRRAAAQHAGFRTRPPARNGKGARARGAERASARRRRYVPSAASPWRDARLGR